MGHANTVREESSADGDRHAPQCVDTSQQLQNEMAADSKATEKEEVDWKTNHQSLMKAKTEEISALSKTIEEKNGSPREFGSRSREDEGPSLRCREDIIGRHGVGSQIWCVLCHPCVREGGAAEAQSRGTSCH